MDDHTFYTLDDGKLFRGTMAEINEVMQASFPLPIDHERLVNICKSWGLDIDWTVPPSEQAQAGQSVDELTIDSTVCCGVLERKPIHAGSRVYDISAGLQVLVINSMQAVATNADGTIAYISWRHNRCWSHDTPDDWTDSPAPPKAAPVSALPIPNAKYRLLFNDVSTVTRSELIDIVLKFHRGDTSLCDYIVGLIVQVAELRGFEPITLVDIEPHKCHAWTVRAYDSKEDAWTKCPPGGLSAEIIDYMAVKGEHKFVAVHWFGKRPPSVSIAKKLKEIGAHRIS